MSKVPEDIKTKLEAVKQNDGPKLLLTAFFFFFAVYSRKNHIVDAAGGIV
jgi:hypothetical protein